MKKIKAEEEWAFQERGRVRGVWHMINRSHHCSVWDALCDSIEASDPANLHHMLTSQREKVNCPECIQIMENDEK